MLYEGGNRVPLIARWPGHIPAGKTSNELIAHVDMLATLSALFEKPLADEAGPDSFNILPALLTEKPAKPCRETLIVQNNNGDRLAIRQGPWKYIPETGKKGKGLPELYNLDNDLSEAKNVADTNAEKAKELAGLLQSARGESRTRK